MSLIIFPTTDWDSFLSVLECTAMSDSYIASNKFASLADDVAKEIILRQTALQISQCPNIVLPDDITKSLQMAQMYLVEQALTTDMISYDANDRAVTSESVDTLAVTYDADKKGGNDDFSPMVSSFLRQYGCNNTNSGFAQVSLGRG